MVITTKTPTRMNKIEERITLVAEVQRPQRKRLSRYKLKKQATYIKTILDDPQIM